MPIDLWDDGHPVGGLAISSQFASPRHKQLVFFGMMQLRSTPGLGSSSKFKPIRLVHVLPDAEERSRQEVLSRRRFAPSQGIVTRPIVPAKGLVGVGTDPTPVADPVLDLVLGVTLDDPNMFAFLAPLPLALPARSAPPPPGEGLLPEVVAFPPHHQLKRTGSANTFIVVIVLLFV